MKTITKMMAAIAIATFATAGNVYAEDINQDNNHEQHHPVGNAPAKADAKAPAKTEKAGMGEGGMMGSMNMDDMHGMMHECMEAHKDGKMCEHEAMEKCESNMKKENCQKMMKEAKAQDKKAKAKK